MINKHSDPKAPAKMSRRTFIRVTGGGLVGASIAASASAALAQDARETGDAELADGLGATDQVDVVVVGAGVVGCCVARELSRYNVRTLVLEAGTDLACGATRANSGVVDAGYDLDSATLKASYAAAGARMFPQWAEELGFGYRQIGALIVAFDEGEAGVLESIAARARDDGAGDVAVVDGDTARYLEPNLAGDVIAALELPGSAVCDPYGLAYAAAENAAANGASFAFDSRVANVAVADDGFDVTTESGAVIHARAVVNAAGVHADEINNLVSAAQLAIEPVRGEYHLYHNRMGQTFSRTVCQAFGYGDRGVLVTPTVHGNLLCGPGAIPQESKADLSTSPEGLADTLDQVRRVWPGASDNDVITTFAGLRARDASGRGDFVVGEAQDAPGFFNAACIDSPGLTAAPAIASDLAGQVAVRLGAQANASFNPRREAPRLFAMMDDEARAQAVAADPRYGRIVCHCCNVTEGELVEAMHRSIPVLSLDALKWRTGATMGPCHGGRCTGEILSIMARELDANPALVDKRLQGSKLVLDKARVPSGLPEETVGSPSTAYPWDFEPFDVVVVGAGVAGLASATSARQAGYGRVLVLERESRTGGLMANLIRRLPSQDRWAYQMSRLDEVAAGALENGVQVLTGIEVLRIEQDYETGLFTLVCLDESGPRRVDAWTVVLACGSNALGAGTLGLAGSRPSGVYTPQTIGTLLDIDHCVPGDTAFVVGDGPFADIACELLINAGVRTMPVSAEAYSPVRLEGDRRLEAVYLTTHGEGATVERAQCDTLVLALGLVSETGLGEALGLPLDEATGGILTNDWYASERPGMYACGAILNPQLPLDDVISGSYDCGGYV